MRKNTINNPYAQKAYILVLMILCSLHLKSQTSIAAGNVSGNWTLVGSPYLIQGHIIIPTDSTLFIQPGVVVAFQGHYKFNILGNIQAIGTPVDSITIIPIDSINGWWGIRFPLTSSTQDSSRFSFCKIQYGNATGTGDNACGGAMFFNSFSKAIISNCLISSNTATKGGGVYLASSSPLLANNRIINNNCYSQGFGGGIYCLSSSPLISNNIIQNNRAGISTSSGSGGGICVSSSAPIIFNNIISNNTSYTGGGGGISLLNGSTGTINTNTISNNSTEYTGAGIYCSQSSPLITNNKIIFNTANGSGFTQGVGGGIGCSYSASNISNNIISNNSSQSFGGGIFDLHSNLSIINNKVNYNSSGQYGGGMYFGLSTSLVQKNYMCNNFSNRGAGIYCSSSSFQQIINNVICNNSAGASGGGIYCEYSVTNQFNNCTISNNKSNTIDMSITNGGGGIYCTQSCTPTFNNCILFDNQALNGNGNQVYLDDDASDPVFKYCDIQGSFTDFYTNGNIYTGAYSNNINSTPQYINASLGSGSGFDGMLADWGLQVSSPCINKGNFNIIGLNLPTVDIINITRIIADTIDIGAFEYNSCNTSTINTTVTQTGISLSANITGAYQWLDCSNNNIAISGATNQTYTPTVNGSYSLKITKGGCVDTSSCYSIMSVGIAELTSNHIVQIFPNPTTGIINILLPGTQPSYSIQLTDIKNQTVIKKTNLYGNTYILDISNFSDGIYFLEINTINSIERIKLIKHN